MISLFFDAPAPSVKETNSGSKEAREEQVCSKVANSSKFLGGKNSKDRMSPFPNVINPFHAVEKVGDLVA